MRKLKKCKIIKVFERRLFLILWLATVRNSPSLSKLQFGFLSLFGAENLLDLHFSCLKFKLRYLFLLQTVPRELILEPIEDKIYLNSRGLLLKKFHYRNYIFRFKWKRMLLQIKSTKLITVLTNLYSLSEWVFLNNESLLYETVYFKLKLDFRPRISE